MTALTFHAITPPVSDHTFSSNNLLCLERFLSILKGRVTKRGGGREGRRETKGGKERDEGKERKSFFDSSPNWLKQPSMSQAEGGSLELYPAIPCGWQGPSMWAMFCYLPRCISRMLDWSRAGSSQTWYATTPSPNAFTSLLCASFILDTYWKCKYTDWNWVS